MADSNTDPAKVGGSVSSDGTKVTAALKAEGSPKSVSAIMGGSMGIGTAWMRTVGNMSAMAIIAGAFLWQMRENAGQAREDRTMFREELKEQRIENTANIDKIGTKLDAVKGAIEINTRAVERVGRENNTVGKGSTRAPGFINPVRDADTFAVPAKMAEQAPPPRAVGKGGEDAGGTRP